MALEKARPSVPLTESELAEWEARAHEDGTWSAEEVLRLIAEVRRRSGEKRRHARRARSHGEASTAPSADEAHFRQLVEKWRQDTQFLSSSTQMAMHPAYQRIIGLGERAVPLLLRELETRPDHWFWALNAITGEDPARGVEHFDDAVRAWLTWGKKGGHIA